MMASPEPALIKGSTIKSNTIESNTMKSGKLRALLVEDSSLDAELVVRELERDGFAVTSDVVQTETEFKQRIASRRYDVVLADYNLPQWCGMDALEIVREQGQDIPVILVTGSLGDVKAVECIKQGITDYVLKDRLAKLPSSVRRALEEKHLRDDQKRAQKKLAEKMDELARSNRDLEQFAYVASHDLQEPLRMVAAYTQLLAERYRGKLDEKADQFIAYASDGALRMQGLIHDLLAFSRVGRNGSAPQSVDCKTVVEEVLRNLQPLLQESGATVQYGALPAVSAERLQIVQLFQNLIANAIKFREAEPPVVCIAAERHDQQWQFRVTDNGIGIPPEHADAIFGVFHRLHTRTEYPGNGIGLAICKKVVEHCGGKIWVEAQAGQGSTFKFTLPAGGADDVASGEVASGEEEKKEAAQRATFA
jgi:signal transduction histidine kinase